MSSTFTAVALATGAGSRSIVVGRPPVGAVAEPVEIVENRGFEPGP